MSVLAHEPRRAALRTQLHGIEHRLAAVRPVVPLWKLLSPRRVSPWKYRRCTSRFFPCQTGIDDHRACSPDRGERRTPSFYRQGYRVGKQWYSALRSSVSLGRLMAPAGGLLIAQRGAQAALQGLLPHARESAAPALRRIAQRCAFRAFAAWWATTRKSTSTPASGPPKAVGPLRQARSERRHRRDEASGQPDPRRGEIDGPQEVGA